MFFGVAKRKVSPGFNNIGLRVFHLRKSDRTPKSIIVPWGNKNTEKNGARGDAPSLTMHFIRVLLSLAAKSRWTVRKIDVESAYFQAKESNRDIFVWLPRERNDGEGLWKLLVPYLWS